MVINSRVLSVRLSSKHTREDAALRIYDELIERGYKPREIIVNALIRAKGHDPQQYDRPDVTMHAIEQVLEAQTEGLREMIRELAATMARQAANGTLPVNADSTAQEYDAYANNLLSGLKSRRRK